MTSLIVLGLICSLCLVVVAVVCRASINASRSWASALLATNKDLRASLRRATDAALAINEASLDRMRVEYASEVSKEWAGSGVVPPRTDELMERRGDEDLIEPDYDDAEAFVGVGDPID